MSSTATAAPADATTSGDAGSGDAESGRLQGDRGAAGVGSGGSAPSRREKKAASTRRAIVHSARQLFEQNGYSETTVDQIAEHADVAARTFFRYFPTKEALLFADFDEAREAMFESLEARPPDEDPLVSIALGLDHFSDVIMDRREDLAWGFRLCNEQDAQEMYERSMLQRQSHVRIAEFIAARLGVEMSVDPRPMAWAMAAMGVFGAVLKIAAATDEDRPTPESDAVRDELRSMWTSTARALDTLASVTG